MGALVVPPIKTEVKLFYLTYACLTIWELLIDWLITPGTNELPIALVFRLGLGLKAGLKPGFMLTFGFTFEEIIGFKLGLVLTGPGPTEIGFTYND